MPIKREKTACPPGGVHKSAQMWNCSIFPFQIGNLKVLIYTDPNLKECMVTVIVVNWNGRALIGDCLDSLKAQTFRKFSIIVVDNGSR